MAFALLSPHSKEACRTRLVSSIAKYDFWSFVSSKEPIYGDAKDNIVRLNKVLLWKGFRRRWPFRKLAGLECKLQDTQGGCEIQCYPRRIGPVRWIVRLYQGILIVIAVVVGLQSSRQTLSGNTNLINWEVVLAALVLLVILTRTNLILYAEKEVQYLKDFVIGVCDARLIHGE